MSHAHRRRRGVAPRPSNKDLRMWERLLKRAALIREGYTADQARAFMIAAEKAAKAVAPVGHQQQGSAFFAVIALGKSWFTPRAAEVRADDIARLARLVGECRAVVACCAPPPVGGLKISDLPAPARRLRKDIDE